VKKLTLQYLCTRHIYKFFLISRITRNGELHLCQTPALVEFAETTLTSKTLAGKGFRKIE
jgi:hypothetical protein